MKKMPVLMSREWGLHMRGFRTKQSSLRGINTPIFDYNFVLGDD